MTARTQAGDNGSGWATKPGGRRVWRAARLTPEKRRLLGLAAPTPTASGLAAPSDDALRSAIEAAVAKVLAETSRTGEPYLAIPDVCRKFDISRSSFYAMLPALEAEGLVVRVPPGGPVRIPAVRFVNWLHSAAEKPTTRRRRKAGR